MAQERAFADSGLSTQSEQGANSCLGMLEQGVDPPLLHIPPDEHLTDHAPLISK
jgi:hypothetical protein